MKKILWISVYWILGINLGIAANPKTVMLVLGSADPTTLEERIEIAARLYRIQSIDKIIVSGGCGAHGSGVCEATRMQQGLQAKGVKGEKIYKEENAKTTVQNYIFSRVLRDEYDQQIIQPGDTVFVVSNHWHAISVAARLQQYDQVIARFYIEGNLIPKETDKVDYVSIFNGQPDNDKFVLRGTWLTPEAVWSSSDSLYYLSGNLIYATDAGNSSFTLRQSKQVFPFLNTLCPDCSRAFIDAGEFWWIRSGNRLLKVDKSSKQIVGEEAWEEWIEGIPNSWKKAAFSTGVIWNETLLLFAPEKILIAKEEKGRFVFVEETVAGNYFKDWPFSWGNSNVASAIADKDSGTLALFRNRETVRIGKDLRLQGKPEILKLKWIDDLNHR
ncbi:YdcF family protein [Sphingobacterium alkalisoli]|uniref:YdcF family protein n=1 Tax=Sphingobacterium alkalisoli TaxID=1874115 RepID=A0A4U0HBB1_9SPHI|nr:YdcF family protein [Sphingobacterium alkalisoli]TJY67852.1 YdcF family protein [Sphingobacterium alkalisoli]GGH10927.1 hypothetical protein GCM10011418_09490 [Sphingobacterium alkalisoli]